MYCTQLTISYVESLMPTSERQNQLMRQYCFECDCLLCQSPEKVGQVKKFLANEIIFQDLSAASFPLHNIYLLLLIEWPE